MFPDVLKLADNLPVYKKNDRKYRINGRRIKILSKISKIYERLSISHFSKFQCGLGQRASAEHYL